MIMPARRSFSEGGYLAALLLSSPVVSLTCTVGKLIEHCAGSLIFFTEVFGCLYSLRDANLSLTIRIGGFNFNFCL